MHLYRICKKQYSQDLSGAGAKIAGGRWNQKGTPVIYTAENRSCAALELLVHIPKAYFPKDFVMVEYEIPDGVSVQEYLPASLPTNWRNYPAPESLAALGTAWADSNKSFLLRIPSVASFGDFNIIINPQHPEMAELKIISIYDYPYDKRLFS